MAEIVPTILTNDGEQYKKLVTTFQPFAKRVQIDVSDGTFAPSATLPLNQVYWPKEWQIDFHIMVVRPSEHLPLILQLKPSLCIFHAESGENLLPLFEQLKSAGIKTGVAIMRSTFPGSIKQYIEAADHVLIFAGEIGKQGSQADMLQTEKIPLVKAINPNAEIGWDGGANLRTVRAIYRAGADVINVGSAISNATDPGAMYESLVADLDKRGVVI
ncbi:hypothetical protein IJH10_02650 [Candidatus Saccharibacteria bacterium]|nr:hypothetical protein [Candidatus Saccharibacteria bacterium]MBR0415591.1 hypothetical protein [Candidatus Saccharibacteria bacterium]